MEPTKILDYRLLDLLNIKIKDECRRHGDPGGDPERSGAIPAQDPRGRRSAAAIRGDPERIRAIGRAPDDPERSGAIPERSRSDTERSWRPGAERAGRRRPRVHEEFQMSSSRSKLARDISP